MNWGSLLIVVLSFVPFLFLNNWLNLIEKYNKSILLKSILCIITYIITFIIIAVKFGYRSIDDLVSVFDNFFEYIKDSFIFRYVQDGGFLANVEKPFQHGSAIIPIIVCIVHGTLLLTSFMYMGYDFEEKNENFSMTLLLSLSVIFAITTVLMFIFKEKGCIIALILLILFIVPLIIRIIKTQHECKVHILQNSIMLSISLIGFIFCWKYTVYTLVLLVVGFFMNLGDGGIGGITPEPTGLERQRKKISAIQGELYDSEWTYKDGYITSADGFTKRKVVDSDINGVITDEYGERHVRTHSSEID